MNAATTLFPQAALRGCRFIWVSADGGVGCNRWVSVKTISTRRGRSSHLVSSAENSEAIEILFAFRTRVDEYDILKSVKFLSSWLKNCRPTSMVQQTQN